MSLFQKAPPTPEEARSYSPLEIPPDAVLEMTEEEWYEKIYRGDSVPQLTIRATIMGSILGFLLAFTNLYIGLKTGWGLGVAITACILSYAVWNIFLQQGWAKSPMTILENNCMQSTASAAGYSTGGTMVSAIAAMLLLTVSAENPGGEHLGTWVLVSWTAFLAVFGTCLAVPMKRNMINKERLKFPSGTAAAVTLHGLYSKGDEALKKARALFWAMGIGSIFPAIIELQILSSKVTDSVTGKVNEIKSALIPGHLDIFNWLPAPGTQIADGKEVAYKPSDWTWTWDMNPVMIAAGALVGLRIGIYMLIGGAFLVYGIGLEALEYVWQSPLGDQWQSLLNSANSGADLGALAAAADVTVESFAGASDKVEKLKGLSSVAEWKEMLTGLVAEENRGAITMPMKAWKEAGLWLGVPIMLSYGLLQFATQWRTILRAFTSFKGSGSSADSSYEEQVAKTEVPGSWFGLGSLLAAAGLIWLANYAFDIPPHFALLAIVMTFFLSLVAARATGESDITPVGAMGKIMQLTFGTIMPQSATANLMSASITANGAGCCADLLNDLKSGYLLGADPRRQFMAQLLGILAGTAATVTGFYLLVPDASVMTGDIIQNGVVVGSQAPAFPAPAAQAWLAVAKLMTGGGIDAMHPMHRTLIGYGLGIGMLCLILEMASPKKWKAWMPSATGIGLGLILPFQYPVSMAVGAFIAYYWTKKNKAHAEEYMIPVAAGLIAGISIMGVVVAILNTVIAG